MFHRPLGPASGFLALLLLVAGPVVVGAEEPKPEPADVEPTDPDYLLQGEYVGQVFTDEGNIPVGVQLVALGKGNFKSVSYTGGLPAEGWEGTVRRISNGGLRDGAVEFSREGYSSTVRDGVISISLAGAKVSELKRIDRESPTMGASPPDNAVVLFDGSTVENFEHGKMTEDGMLLPGCTSKEKFGSGKLHLEFRVPFMPEARDQARGNSGVYLQGRYEVQILDSFGEEEANNVCGAIHGLKAPDQNMSYPPGAWQTYDIDFTAAEYRDGKIVKDPTVTVKHNNVLVDRKTSLPQATRSAPLAAGEGPGPLYLQDHGNPVRYRNIWFVKQAAEAN